MAGNTELATFGGGCFWCTEAVFRRLRGVLQASPGYMGGTIADPSYEQVCTGRSGHAEVIRIEFEPQQIGFAQLLEVFFATHDPTTLNRQGNDVGTQYRSVIYFHSPQQRQAATDCIEQLQQARHYPTPIVTEVSPAGTFYPAEAYHHRYFELHSMQPYCAIVIQPKLDKSRKLFAELQQ